MDGEISPVTTQVPTGTLGFAVVVVGTEDEMVTVPSATTPLKFVLVKLPQLEAGATEDRLANG